MREGFSPTRRPEAMGARRDHCLTTRRVRSALLRRRLSPDHVVGIDEVFAKLRVELYESGATKLCPHFRSRVRSPRSTRSGPARPLRSDCRRWMARRSSCFVTNYQPPSRLQADVKRGLSHNQGRLRRSLVAPRRRVRRNQWWGHSSANWHSKMRRGNTRRIIGCTSIA